MRFLKNKKFFKLIKGLIVILVILISLRLLISTFTLNHLKIYIKELGPLAPLAIIIYTIISHIFAPLSGTPAILLSFTLFGIYKTMIYLYIASLTSAVINFYISRKYGRKKVIKLVGKKTMKEIDNYLEFCGTKVLILSRLFGFAVYELISYAAGLTNIKFQKYFIITLLFGFIPNFIFIFLFKDIDIYSRKDLCFWFGTLIIAGGIFSFFIRKYFKKSRS